MAAVFLAVPVREVVDKYDSGWKTLCAAVVYRRGFSLRDGTGHMVGMGRNGGFVTIMRPDGFDDEQAKALAEELATEFSRVIELDRRNTALGPVQK